MHKWAMRWDLIRYGWLNRWRFLLCAGVAFFGVLAFMLKAPESAAGMWQTLDPVIGMATFVVAIAVWFGNIHAAWDDQLPRRLNVYFLCDGKPILVCKGAPLPSESDARALGQQIGLQMSGEDKLLFDPARVEQRRLPNEVFAGVAFKPIELQLHLFNHDKKPAKRGSRDEPLSPKEIIEQVRCTLGLTEDQYKLWQYVTTPAGVIKKDESKMPVNELDTTRKLADEGA